MLSTLDPRSQKMLDLTKDLWNEYRREDRPPESGQIRKSKHGGYQKNGPVAFDDDTHDFRQAIHTLQRIIMSKRLRQLGEMSLPAIIREEVEASHPGATDFNVSVKFKQTTHETKSKEMKLDGESDYMYTVDTTDEQQVGLMAPMGKASREEDLDDDDDDNYLG